VKAQEIPLSLRIFPEEVVRENPWATPQLTATEGNHSDGLESRDDALAFHTAKHGWSMGLEEAHETPAFDSWVSES
jgi:hypothetical protein